MNQAEKNRICELIKQNEKTEIVINYTPKSGAAKRHLKSEESQMFQKILNRQFMKGKILKISGKKDPYHLYKINLKDVAPYDKEECQTRNS